MEGLTVVETKTWQALLEKVDAIQEYVEKSLADKSEFMTIEQVAKMMGFSTVWVINNKQDIGYTTITGRNIRFKRKDVDAYMESNYFKAKAIGRNK